MNIQDKMTETKKFQVGDIVNLPFDEVGIIEEELTVMWGAKWQCRILIATLSDLGSWGQFSDNDLSHCEPESDNAKKLQGHAKAIIKYFNRYQHCISSTMGKATLEFNLELQKNRLNNLETFLKEVKGGWNRPDVEQRIEACINESRGMIKDLMKEKHSKL